MSFAHSELFVWLWLIPLCGVLILLANRCIHRRLQLFAKERVSELLSHEMHKNRTFIKSLLFLCGVALLIIALARPRWGFDWQEVPQGGVDIMLVLDLSTSMLATDISPSRLERAKREIIDLIQMLKGDRIGLVVFAGVSFVQCPLTADYRLAQLFVQQLNVDLMPVQGTNIGSALGKALMSLDKASEATSQGKAIILMTDGEDHEMNVKRIVAEAKQKNINIYAIGIGSKEGAPIPMPGGGFKKDNKGQVVVSRLDEKMLQEISASTGGNYVRSTVGDMDLDLIYKGGIRSAVEDQDYGVKRQKIWHEIFQWFVLFAFVFLFFEFFLGYGRKKRTRAITEKIAMLFFSVSLIGVLQSRNIFAEPSKKAEEAFQKKEYNTASKLFMDAEIEDPSELKHIYNRGISQFYEKKYDESIQAFLKSSQSKDLDIKKKSLFNLGNTQVAKGDLQGAVRSYDQLLKLSPKDKETKENKIWVEEQIRKREQQKQKNKDDSDKNKEEKKKDKEDKSEQNRDKQSEKQENKENKSNQSDDNKENKQQQSQQESESQKKDKEQQNQSKESNQSKKDSRQSQTAESLDEKNQSGVQNEKQLMTKEEAERILRVIDDLEKVYGMPPKIKGKPKEVKKDW